MKTIRLVVVLLLSALFVAFSSAVEDKEKSFRASTSKKAAETKERSAIGADYLSELERGVLNEINLARTDPRGYARHIEKLREAHLGNGVFSLNGSRVTSKEGLAAVEEAIDFLKKSKPISPLSPSEGLSRAAKAHADDIGSAGITEHTGTDGSTVKDRVEKQGNWRGALGENIAFGLNSGRDIVVYLIVDDGVPGRGHRMNIFKARYKVVGVSNGKHEVFGTCCVIDFAGGFSD